MQKTGILAGIGLFVITVFTVALMYLGANNKEVDLKNQIYAQNKVMANYQDRLWKVLKQKAGVADEYKLAFKDIYIGIMQGRYQSGSNDGSLMKMIQESNPTFDVALYKDLMNSIEIERTGFYNEQNKLIDLGREHDNLLEKAPSKWFVDAAHIPIRIITSQRTDDVMKTGQDNDISLFKN